MVDMHQIDRLIIIAFDGLDYKKIQEYGCENVMQEDFGRVDLSNMPLTTGPLWSSFITGEFPSEHGVKKTMNWTDPRVQKFENIMEKIPFTDFWKGIRWTILRNLDSLNTEVIGAHRGNLQVDTTIFDDIEPSVSLNVPGQDINTALSSIVISRALGKDAPIPKEVMERDIEAEHMKRKDKTFEFLEDGDFALLMSHFHKSDFMQHLYGFNEGKERELYREFDNLARKILEYTTEDDLVIFCSDHGLEEGSHRRQAFYSANRDLEVDKPHITDFRDILNMFDIRNSETLDDIDI
jgi:predicted AlkP superfamily pyrophosphatase or phosphodiesterase